MQKSLVCAYNSQDFVQTPESFARLHNRATVTFTNSVTQLSFSSKSSKYFHSQSLIFWEDVHPYYKVMDLVGERSVNNGAYPA